MRATFPVAVLACLSCARVHQPGKVVLERSELSGVETEHMTSVFLFEGDETRIYMDARYDLQKRPGPPDTVHVCFTIVTPWGFEKDIDPTWVVVTDGFRRDWGDLNRDESGVALSAGGRVRELFSIDVPPLALETIASATNASFRFGKLDVPLKANDIATVRKLVATWTTSPAKADTDAESEPEPAKPNAPPVIAPPSNIKI